MRYAAMLVLAVVLPAAPARSASPVPPLLLWMETSANLPALSTREGVAAILERARAAGVTAVIPEVKNAWGFVTYESTFAPHIRTSPLGRSFPPVYDPPASWYPAGYDLLQVVVEEAHARGLEVYAAINVFGEGVNGPQATGLAYERPHWQTVHAGVDGTLLPASLVGPVAFANPGLPEVQLYELAVIGEVAARYQVDGIVLDRIRYPDGTADVSEDSRRQFEQWLGRRLDRWPDGALRVVAAPDGVQVVPGPFFRQWVAWRATVIQRFVRAAAQVVRGIRPEVRLSAYVGAWYPVYWNEGVNWAGPEAPLPYAWAGWRWRQAAVAEFFDFLMVGLYYPDISRMDALRSRLPWWMSVEGGALLARNLTGGATMPVGSLLLSVFEGRPDRFRAALRSTRRLTAGVMLFDLVFLDRYGWWDLLTP